MKTWKPSPGFKGMAPPEQPKPKPQFPSETRLNQLAAKRRIEKEVQDRLKAMSDAELQEFLDELSFADCRKVLIYVCDQKERARMVLKTMVAKSGIKNDQ